MYEIGLNKDIFFILKKQNRKIREELIRINFRKIFEKLNFRTKKREISMLFLFLSLLIMF